MTDYNHDGILILPVHCPECETMLYYDTIPEPGDEREYECDDCGKEFAVTCEVETR